MSGTTAAAVATVSAAEADSVGQPTDVKYPHVTHVLFDMDGLLLDTESVYTTAQKAVLLPYGKEFTWELKSKMMGMKAIEAADLLITELQLQGQLTAEQFLSQREEIMDATFESGVELLPGAERLLSHLFKCKVPFALATSSHRRHYELKTAAHGELFKLFDAVVTGDMVTAGKPAPDIFLAAAAALSPPPVSPAHVLVFEDAPSGVAAGVAAGMQVVMVPDPNLDPATYAGNGATLLLSSLDAFDPAAFGLPPYSTA